MEIGITETLEPTRVSYHAVTDSGEEITGDIYTLNKGTLTEAYKKLAKSMHSKEKLSRLCLQVQNI
jgi:hypothetical protein